jgi:hypothetical protein
VHRECHSGSIPLEPSTATAGVAVAGDSVGRNLETGGEIELGGAVFPVEPGEDEGMRTRMAGPGMDG